MAYTAQKFVNRLRDLAQVFSPSASLSQFVDGFTETINPGSGPTSLLDAINEYVSTLSPYRYAWETFTGNTTIGTSEYAVDPSVYDIRSVLYNGQVLLQTTREALEALDLKYATTSGTPTKYYKEGLDLFLWPTPNAVQAYVYRASVQDTILVAASDTLTYMPAAQQWRVPYGAAVLMCGVIADDPVNTRRLAVYAAIAGTLEEELANMGIGDNQDFATKVGADNFVAQKGGRQTTRGFTNQLLGMQGNVPNGTQQPAPQGGQQ